MIGNILLLTLTWLLLRFKKENLTVLTGTSFLVGLLLLLAGFVSTAFLAGGISFLFAAISGFNWEPVAGLGIGFLLKGSYNTFNSVLYEELIFRGSLLYLAILWIGERKANLLSALAFGIYHWFTFNIWGNPIIMLWVLVYSGLWGLMLAYAYSRAGSIALPIGLHWGWNFVDQLVFNKQGGSLFTAVTSLHTRYLSTLEEMLYLRLPAIAFAVIVMVLLCQYLTVNVKPRHTR